ncbi:sporulation related domain protein [Burkholderia pseudomallei MSHR4012]|uniref:phosphodiester glycosidase family protein n=1 Tax=Burkholderia pseudomallei TaxID=28450 RepID=UPI000537ED81|nr:phosphodiester glycosidase family protein [Burkholderia pseudomallei]KGV35293.1 sporulation related domain protein [Burkholderia pseudomallei MSHR4012]KGV59316.1 sporulation related domain protein [Burkholderia pseudomallei MSHR4003]
MRTTKSPGISVIRQRLAVALPLALTLTLASCGGDDLTPAAQRWAMPGTELPLGPQGLAQSVSTQTLAAGVAYYQIKRGAASAADFWTVNLGFYATQAAAQADAANLAAAGFATRVDASAGTDLQGKVLGYWLSAGRYATQAEATAAAARIAQATQNRYKPGTRHTSLAGAPTNINPFGAPLPPRSPVGATVVDGRLVAAAIGRRPGLLLARDANGRQRATVVRNLATAITLTDAQGSAIAVQTLNRPILGTVVNCGAQARTPTSEPAQDTVCTNDDDLVMYDSLYLRGGASNTLVDAGYQGARYELVVDANGAVVAGHATLGAPPPPPPNGYVLQGLGASAAWLQAHATPGTRLAVSRRLSADGADLALASGTSLVEAGPTLSVPNLAQSAAQEGFAPTVGGVDAGEGAAANGNWYNGWYVARNGRTAAGVAADGTILLVEIDGRQPTLSVGTSIPETAAVMAWLGATSAVNLDGGGSSNMVVGGKMVGHPSDAVGERGVGDTLMLLPG